MLASESQLRQVLVLVHLAEEVGFALPFSRASRRDVHLDRHLPGILRVASWAVSRPQGE